MILFIPDLGKYMPQVKDMFYHRTYVCNEIMDNMDKFKIQFLRNEESFDKIIPIIDKNIDDKLNNNLPDLENMNGDIAKNNMILGNKNSIFLYTIMIEFDEDEYNKKKDKLLNSFCTPNINIKKVRNGVLYFSFICRNEAEVYVFLKAIRDNNIKFKLFLISAYCNVEATKDRNTSITGFLKEEDIDLLLKNYNRTLLYIVLSVNHHTLSDERKTKLYSLNDLINRPATYFIEEYKLDIKSLDLEKLSFTLYQLAEETYTKYTKLYAFVLLHIEDERVKRLLDVVSSEEDSLEKSVKVFDCAEELGFKDNDPVLENRISTRVSELIKEKRFDLLMVIMDIIDSTFIGYILSPIFKDVKKLFN